MPSLAPIPRLVPFVTTFCAVTCVYFQASSASSLLASTLLPQLLPEARTFSERRLPDAQRRALANVTMMANNPFDWRVDLNPPPETPSNPTKPETRTLVPDNPLLVKVCTAVSVSIVTESMDPLESLTVLQGPDDQGPTQRRVGDHIGDYEVAYIGFNRTKASPAVWLANSEGLCQSLLFAPTPVESESPAKSDATEPEPKPRTKLAGKSTLNPEIAKRITKLNDTHVAVERGVVDEVLADPSVFMGSARIVPAKDGSTQSSVIRLFGVREGTLLGALNLKNGDVLTSINGFDLSSPEQALNAYARMRSAETLSVEVLREGKPVNLQVSIR